MGKSNVCQLKAHMNLYDMLHEHVYFKRVSLIRKIDNVTMHKEPEPKVVLWR